MLREGLLLVVRDYGTSVSSKIAINRVSGNSIDERKQSLCSIKIMKSGASSKLPYIIRIDPTWTCLVYHSGRVKQIAQSTTNMNMTT